MMRGGSVFQGIMEQTSDATLAGRTPRNIMEGKISFLVGWVTGGRKSAVRPGFMDSSTVSTAAKTGCTRLSGLLTLDHLAMHPRLTVETG